MQSQPLAIEMAGLTKQFGRHLAVDSLNLTVHPGSVFGLCSISFAYSAARGIW
jgi:ABC-type sugar transport system ATPase subunit